MSRATFRRVAFVAGVSTILGFAIVGTLLQRASLANFSAARHGVLSDIRRYEALLVNGESRARAAAALAAAGAQVESTHGDIVVTVLRELNAPGECRSLVAQLQVGIDARDRVEGWESPPPHAECD